MDSGFSKYFLRNTVVPQGCPPSPTFFGLCINKLKEIENKAAKERLDGPKLMQEVMFIVLYVNDVLFSHILDDMQHLMYWEHFVQSSSLLLTWVAKRMAITAIYPTHYPTLT